MPIDAKNPITLPEVPAIPAQKFTKDWVGIYLDGHPKQPTPIALFLTRYREKEDGSVDILRKRQFDVGTDQDLAKRHPDIAKRLDAAMKEILAISAIIAEREIYPNENLQANPRLRNG